MNYRLWNNPSLDNIDEISKRITFLTEYTRRQETTMLLTASNFKGKKNKKGELFLDHKYGCIFYERSILDYIATGEVLDPVYRLNRELYNSRGNNKYANLEERYFRKGYWSKFKRNLDKAKRDEKLKPKSKRVKISACE